MKRIICVSNRLPFTITREEGVWKFTESVGGLATGLSAYFDSLNRSSSPVKEYVWVGWPGSTIREEFKDEVRCRALETYRSFPVFLSEEDVEKFYQGFCNKTIWPLFHYFPEYTLYNQEYWQHYKKVNLAFAETLVDLLKPGDVVWIHDYHLMLLPKLLRERCPEVSIGFFLHIPFPTYEVFRLLPATWRKELLEGLLGVDLIGFHTYDYLQYFLRCVLRILGHDHNVGQLFVNNHVVKAGSYPMGIDFKKFFFATDRPELLKEQEELKQPFGDVKIVLSIDRLDYSKGIINRLEGFALMLEQNPEWHGKVALVVIVVPSRIGLEYYDRMKKQIEEQVGKINGKFGTLSWTPIRYQYRSLAFPSLVALYGVSDVALVTPLRDGMNLIAKEYIASRRDATGVLILSEMAGAAKELGEAVIINPNNREEIATAIKEALEMPRDEQIGRNTIMQNRLKRYDILKWANEFIRELSSCRQSGSDIAAKVFMPAMREELMQHFDRSANRLLLLDYDGTLVGFARRPKEAKPTEILMRLLRTLAGNPRNEVVIISGRKKDNLEEWFGRMNVSLAAEHGAWIKERNDQWRLLKPMTSDWKEKVLPILEMHVDRLPGALLEEKECSLAWHYRASDPEHGEQMSRELMDDLVAFTANIDVQVLQGNKVIEVRNAGINKGAAGMHLLRKESYDFVLAVGDDWTDEDLFAALPKESYTLHVGFGRTQANYQVRSPHDVLSLLQQLADRK